MQDQLSLNSYSYKHYRPKDPSQAVDIHDVFIKKSRMRVMLSYAGILSLLVNVYYSLVMKVFFVHAYLTSQFLQIFVKKLQYTASSVRESIEEAAPQMTKHFATTKRDLLYDVHLFN